MDRSHFQSVGRLHENLSRLRSLLCARLGKMRRRDDAVSVKFTLSTILDEALSEFVSITPPVDAVQAYLPKSLYAYPSDSDYAESLIGRKIRVEIKPKKPQRNVNSCAYNNCRGTRRSSNSSR